VLTVRGRAEVPAPEGLAPLHLEYEPGDYERVFALSDAVDPAGIEARVRGGVLHLRLPEAGPAALRRIEVKGRLSRAGGATPERPAARPPRWRGGRAAEEGLW
jgi:hypothetical protein